MLKILIAASLAAGLAAPVLAAADAPADAAIGLAEFQSAARQQMLSADADRDGKLSPAELSAAREAMRGGATGPGAPRGGGAGAGRGAGRMFEMFDANGDGLLDAAELDAMSARRFQRMDANGDGKVTAAEREAMQNMRRGGTGWRGGANPDEKTIDRQDD
jgi:hypothetical protein